MLLHQPSVHLQEGATERRWHWQNSLVRLVTILTTKVRITASYYHATRYSIGLHKRIPRHHQKDWWVQRKFAKNCEGTAMRVSATDIPHTRTVTEGMYVCSYIRTYVCVYACMYVWCVCMLSSTTSIYWLVSFLILPTPSWSSFSSQLPWCLACYLATLWQWSPRAMLEVEYLPSGNQQRMYKTDTAQHASDYTHLIL